MPIEDIIVCSNNENLEQSISYIIDHLKNESNILNVTFRDISTMSKIVITPNKSTIGKEFQKDSRNVLNYISKLDDEYLLNNYKNIIDKEFSLNETHFNVVRSNTSIENYGDLMNDSNDLLVYINMTQSNEVMLQYLSKVMATSIQKFRKEINLKPWDKIAINFITESEMFIHAFENYNQNIFDLVRNPVFMNREMESNQFNETSIDHDDDTFKIRIYKRSEETLSSSV